MAATCDAIQVYGNVNYILIQKLQSYQNYLVAPSQMEKKPSFNPYLQWAWWLCEYFRRIRSMLWLLRGPAINFNTVQLRVVILHADCCSRCKSQGLSALKLATTSNSKSHCELNSRFPFHTFSVRAAKTQAGFSVDVKPMKSTANRHVVKTSEADRLLFLSS